MSCWKCFSNVWHLKVLTLLGLAVLDYAAQHDRADHRGSAQCSLKIIGDGRPLSIVQYNNGDQYPDGFRLAAPGPAAAAAATATARSLPTPDKLQVVSLHCHSRQGLVPVLINGNIITTWHVQQFTGVQAEFIKAAEDTDAAAAANTSQHSISTSCAGNGVSMALLQFCGNFHIQFIQITIKGLQLIQDIEPRDGLMTRNASLPVVLFRGGPDPSRPLSVDIHQALIMDNVAHAALLVEGSSWVNISSMNCKGSMGHFGACVAVTDAAVVRLRDSVLENCTAVRGAGLFVSGNASVTIVNSTFDACFCSDSGCAVQARGRVRVEVSNSTFRNNCAANLNRTAGDGGAIAVVDYAAVKMHSSVLRNNTAAYNGGAVYAKEHAELEVINSTFLNNSAVQYAMKDGWGGAVAVDTHASARLHNVHFSQNHAAYSGGAVVAWELARLEITNSTFCGNRASNSDRTDGNGGAITVEFNSSASIRSSVFRNNTAAYNGGAVYAKEHAELEVINSTFLNNSAVQYAMKDGWGGAVAVYTHASARLHNVHFSQNHAAYSGGAVAAWELARLEITNSTFCGNRASNSDRTVGDGGAITVEFNSSASIHSSVFRNNTAAYNGGAVYAKEHAELEAINSTFLNNSAVQYAMKDGWGGAVAVYTHASARLHNVHFSQNHAAYSGGAIAAWELARLEITNSTFCGNRASNSDRTVGDGGAITVEFNSSASIHSSVFRNNTAAYNGGAVYAKEHAELEAINSTFLNNSAVQYAMKKSWGGGVAVDTHASARLHNVHFSQNHAAYSGGAVAAWELARLEITNSTFCGNRASNSDRTVGDGGAITVEFNSSASIHSSVFRNNTAAYNGGAVYINNQSALDVTRSMFDRNLAADSGGENGWGGAAAVYSNSTARISSSRCYDNRAALGGGALVGWANSRLEVKDSDFVNNHADSYDQTSGGAVSVTGNVTAVFQNSSFVNNTAAAVGGAIAIEAIEGSQLSLLATAGTSGSDWQDFTWYTVPSNVTLQHCNITNNTAGQAGGAFMVMSATLTVLDSIMRGNACTARGSTGGLLSLSGNSSLPAMVLFEGNTISSSRADNGGAVIATVLDVTNVTMPPNITCLGQHKETDAGGNLSAAYKAGETRALRCSTLDFLYNIIDNNTAYMGQGMVLEGRLLRLNFTGSNMQLNSSTLIRKGGLCVRGDNAPSADELCELCPQDMFSVDPAHQQQCASCPQHAVCVGGAVVVADDGFFNTENESSKCMSTDIIRCAA
jgi:predicted outer membrane repeat protein